MGRGRFEDVSLRCRRAACALPMSRFEEVRLSRLVRQAREALCRRRLLASALTDDCEERVRSGSRTAQSLQERVQVHLPCLRLRYPRLARTRLRALTRCGVQRSRGAFHATEVENAYFCVAIVATGGCRYTRPCFALRHFQQRRLAIYRSGVQQSKLATPSPQPRRRGGVRLQQCNLEVHVLGKMGHRIAVANPACLSHSFAPHVSGRE